MQKTLKVAQGSLNLPSSSSNRGAWQLEGCPQYTIAIQISALVSWMQS